MNAVKEVYEILKKTYKISIDSRKIPVGSIFIALKGEHFDAHRFVDSALKSGAALAVIDNPDFAVPGKTVLVENSLDFLQQLANYHRRQFSFPLIAVTGTNGKTTTKELCYSVLKTKYKVAATQGNYNNHIGLPLTLLSFPPDLQYGIVEMGANHPGEIAALCEIAMPDYGIITNTGKAHLEGFGSLQGVIDTKTELYRFLKKHNNKAFVNGDNPVLSKHPSLPEAIFYGKGAGNFLRGEILASNPYLSVEIVRNGEKASIHSHLIGTYNFENILAAACVGAYFDISLADIKSGIESYQPSNIRSQLVRSKSNQIILDAYNANPTSMLAAIDNFIQMKGENKLLFLGDMLELGKDSVREHQKIVDYLKRHKLNAFLTGKEFGKTKHPYPHFADTEAFISFLRNHPVKNAFILIKASRGIQLEKVAKVLND